MNTVIINDITVTENRLDCLYSISGEWKKYFEPDEAFFIEYSKCIDSVPKNVAVIPLICNILPIAWIFDAEIILEEIDKDFYDSIDEFKQGYIQMYPKLNFRGKVTAKKLVEIIQEDNINKSAAFFSGGVDAFQTLISHINEKPTLITLWGSDISFEDQKGWNLVNQHIIKTADENKIDFVIIKSSFRRIIKENELTGYVSELAKDNWWHGFQHGIGLLGHMAPYAFQYKIKKVYIASSFTVQERGKVTCASDPSIDNFVRFCGCQVFHDGYEYSRQDKIYRICEYVKRTGKKIQLRVCWESKGGSNCCGCEKCYRTILGIIAEKENPKEYGFNYTDNNFKTMMFDLRSRINIKQNFRYKYIQDAFHENYSINEVDKRLRWFYKIGIGNTSYTHSELIFLIIGKIRKLFSKIKRRLVH